MPSVIVWLFSLFCLISLPLSATHTLLRLHVESEPETLDTAQATGLREHLILLGLFEGLTRYHPKTLEPLPGTAEKWRVSADGKTYHFFLRQEVLWSDGKPVTAQDFWNAWEHLLNPKTASPYAFQLFYVENGRAYHEGKLKDPGAIGVEVKNPRLLEVRLERPVPYFLYLTSFASLAPRRLDAKQQTDIGNGAFILARPKASEGIMLLPNPHYWGKKALKLRGILFRPFGDFDTALKFYGRTGIDIMVELPPHKVPLLKFRSDFRSAPVLRTDYLLFNTRRERLNDPAFRRALSLAVDRKKITDEILKRDDLPYGYFVPPGMPGYTSPGHPQTFDPWKAKHLLDQLGYGNKKKLPALTLLYSKASDRRMVAQALQAMWEKHLGISVTLLEEDWDAYLRRRQRHDFDISWGGWSGDYLDPNTFLELFLSDNPQNHGRWSHAAYDALVRQAQSTQERGERARLFREAEAILLREAAVAPVFSKVKNYLIQPYVRGFYPNLLDVHPLRDVYSLRP